MLLKCKTIAYLRVSTTDQDLDKNKSAILLLANNKELGQVKFIVAFNSGQPISYLQLILDNKIILAFIPGQKIATIAEFWFY